MQGGDGMQHVLGRTSMIKLLGEFGPRTQRVDGSAACKRQRFATWWS